MATQPRLVHALVIGRNSPTRLVDVDLSPNVTVSRLHAEIAGGYLTDLQSLNGTYVNGKRVQGRVLLHSGDLIRFGTVTVRYIENQTLAPTTTISPAADDGDDGTGGANIKFEYFKQRLLDLQRQASDLLEQIEAEYNRGKP